MKEFAVHLEEARAKASAVSPITEKEKDFDLQSGYRVQKEGLMLALSRGERLCGYKMGLTSKAKQRDVNVHESIRGYLLESMEIPSGAPIATGGRIHPRVEPEVVVVLSKPLKGPDVTLEQVREALAWVGPGFEILDSRFKDFSFKMPDVVADNTSASGFVRGKTNFLDRLEKLNLMGVTILKNGEVEATGAPAAVLGNPLLAVVELANALDVPVEPGMVILTGGITTSVPFKKGDRIEVVWPDEILSFRGE